jgi:hypothetical protein
LINPKVREKEWDCVDNVKYVNGEGECEGEEDVDHHDDDRHQLKIKDDNFL